MNKLKYVILLLLIVNAIAIPSALIPSSRLPSTRQIQIEGVTREGEGAVGALREDGTINLITTELKADLKKKPVDDDDDDDKSKDGDDKDDDKDGDKDGSDSDEDKKDDKNSKDASKDEGGDDSENDSKSDKSQTDSKSDDTSEENSNPLSKSNPDTEEEGDSSSASNTSEEKDDSSAEEASNTTENDSDESETTSEETSEEDSDSDSSDSKSDEENKLLVILVDGVRPDYLTRDENKLKFLQKIKKSGSMVKYVKPVFPANPFPNWYSIATGKYPEKHNIINDYMYDAKRKELFLKGTTKDKFWWDDAEPIWITAKKHRKRVHVSWWTGCDIEIKKHLPTFCDPYNDKMTEDTEKYPQIVADRLKEIVRGFEKDDYDLAMVYYEAVGDAGRKFGPDSKRTKKSFRTLDKILDDLLDLLEEKKLSESVNVVILSDTGMSSTKDQRVINLEKYIDFNDIVKLVGEGAFVMIQPEKRKTESVRVGHLLLLVFDHDLRFR